MNRYYQDIIERIPEAPKWWDENAIPRYEPFAPDQCANIYAHEVVLFEIACQSCGRLFDVAMSWDKAAGFVGGKPSLQQCIQDGLLHYGDPPNVHCCPSGPSMNCLDLRVKEYWRRDREGGKLIYEWERHSEFEVELPDSEEAEI